MSFIDPLTQMIAERECERLIKIFANLNDAGHYEKLANMFTEDGVFIRPSNPDLPIKGRSAILEAFKSRPERVSCHFVCNTIVTLISQTKASATSNILLVSGSPGKAPVTALPPHMVGSFKDKLELQNGVWLFTERVGSLQLRLP